jgi:hypothetical protein
LRLHLLTALGDRHAVRAADDGRVRALNAIVLARDVIAADDDSDAG